MEVHGLRSRTSTEREEIRTGFRNPEGKGPLWRYTTSHSIRGDTMHATHQFTYPKVVPIVRSPAGERTPVDRGATGAPAPRR